MNFLPLSLETEEMSVDSLPQINDESLIENKFTEKFTQPMTGPVRFQRHDISLQQDLTTNQTLQMPTMPIEPMSVEPMSVDPMSVEPKRNTKTSIPIFNENEQQLTGKILSDVPSIANLSIDELDEKENILPEIVAQKRDSSVLTPRCPRSSKIIKETKSNVSLFLV